MQPRTNRAISTRLTALVVALTAGTGLAQPVDSSFVGPMPQSPEPKVVVPAAPTPELAPPRNPTPPATPLTHATPTPAEVATPSAPIAKPRIEALPLGKLEQAQPPVSAGAAKPASGLSFGGTQTIIALSAVIALMLLAAGLFKRYSRLSGSLTAALGAGGRAPSGILQVLGRYPAGRGITLVLLRVDRRILLVTQSKISGLGRMSGGLSMSVLTEITDASDVASIIAKASAADGSSPSAHFNAALEQASTTDDETPQSAPKRRESVDASALARLLPVNRAPHPVVRTPAQPTPTPPRSPATSSIASNAARKDAAVADLRQRLASMRANTATVQVKLGTRTSTTEVTA